MNFVDDIHLEAGRHGRVADRVGHVANVLHAVMRCRIDFDDVDVAPFADRPARLANAAWSDGRATLPVGADAVQRLGDQARGRGLADPAHSGQQECVGDPPALDRIGQRLHHRVLADQLGEGLRAVLAREHAICRRFGGRLRPFGKVQAQARRFGVVHRPLFRRGRTSLRAKRSNPAPDCRVAPDQVRGSSR